jgi:alpha-methylacyl-CoA racemase
VPPLNLVADYGGGALYLAFGVMAALFERQRSGCGQVVDAAMVDGAASLASIFYGLQAAGQWDGGRGENLLDGGAPFYACYETADGQWLSVAPLEPKFFAEFARRIDLDSRFVQRQYDRKLWPEMRAAIAATLKTKTRAECVALFDGSDACVAPVLSFSEAPLHGHAQARKAFIELNGVTQPGPAPRFSRSAPPPPRPAPAVGQHTRAVLAQAGWAADEIDSLLAAGVALQAAQAVEGAAA